MQNQLHIGQDANVQILRCPILIILAAGLQQNGGVEKRLLLKLFQAVLGRQQIAVAEPADLVHQEDAGRPAQQVVGIRAIDAVRARKRRITLEMWLPRLDAPPKVDVVERLQDAVEKARVIPVGKSLRAELDQPPQRQFPLRPWILAG